MDVLGWILFVAFLILMICGLVKVVEWRVKKVYKQLHPKEDDSR